MPAPWTSSCGAATPSCPLPGSLIPTGSGQHGLEIVKAVVEALFTEQELVGKRISARIALSDGPGGHAISRHPVITDSAPLSARCLAHGGLPQTAHIPRGGQPEVPWAPAGARGSRRLQLCSIAARWPITPRQTRRKPVLAGVDIGWWCRYGFSRSPERQKGLADTNYQAEVRSCSAQDGAVVEFRSQGCRTVTGLTTGPGGPQ